MIPRFSILVPVYNRAELVKETINSVLAQTFTDFELVLVDDGSKDHSLAVLESYRDPRIKVIGQTNQGAEAARFNATTHTSGEYYVLLDCDDLLLPGALATYDRIIRCLKAPPVIIGKMEEFGTHAPLTVDDSPDGIVEVITYDNLFQRDRPIGTTCSQIVAKRSVVEATGAFRPSTIAWPFETADIMLSLSTLGPWVTVQRPTTIAYRRHETNTIGNVGYMARMIPRLVNLEKQGAYPGGSTWKFARRAYIGGVAWNWCRQALKAGLFGPAGALILNSGPMLARGLLRKLTQKFRASRQPVRLPA